MSNKEKNQSTVTSIEEVNDSLVSIEQKIEQNQKAITRGIIAVVAVAALVLGYIYGIHNPKVEASKDAIAMADIAAMQQNDSIALAQYMAVADQYSTAPANRAALEAASRLYLDGEYENAIAYLQKYDASKTVVGAAAQSLMADCYVNLKNYDEAIKYFDKAIAYSADNAIYTPVFMLKKATVLAAKGEYAAEAKVYADILANYPEYEAAYNVNIEKYKARAEANASK
ncbi:MAG: tetratricopeptide repeat protein [Bacteroidales bacterium]